MIKEILTTIAFILAIVLSAYLMTSFIELSLNIAEWSNWSRAILLAISASIFGIFTNIGNKLNL